MKRMKNDPALAGLPAPMTLTPEQLAQVASETGAMLGAGGGALLTHIIIAGGYPVGPLMGANLGVQLGNVQLGNVQTMM